MVKKAILLALMALVLVLSISVSVLAGPVPDTARRCSVTVNFQKENTPVSGGSVVCTRVGYIYKEGGSYRFRRVLDNYDMVNLQDPDTAQELVRFVSQNNITGTAKTVGKDGTVTFEDLETGVYLIRQKTAPDGYMPMKPFVVTLPYLKDGEYIYDLDASAKTELDKEPTEPTEPSTGPTEPSTGPTEPSTGPTEPSTGPTEPSTGPTEPSTGPTEPSTGPTEPSTGPTEPSTGPTEPSTGPTEPTEPTEPGGGDSPQTGQLNWPIPVMAGLGIFCLCLGMYFASKDRKEEA